MNDNRVLHLFDLFFDLVLDMMKGIVGCGEETRFCLLKHVPFKVREACPPQLVCFFPARYGLLRHTTHVGNLEDHCQGVPPLYFRCPSCGLIIIIITNAKFLVRFEICLETA